MQTEITTGETKASYIELSISSDPRDGFYEITFRAYPSRVFVAVEDNRDNQSGGADLEDCWIAPAVIIQKTPRSEFDPKKAFINAMHYGGYNDEFLEDEWNDIKNAVDEWLTKSGILGA